MKQNSLKALLKKASCDPASCNSCPQCKVVNFQDKRTDMKAGISQLYGKEAEHYFFYYAFTMKQGS